MAPSRSSFPNSSSSNATSSSTATSSSRIRPIPSARRGDAINTKTKSTKNAITKTKPKRLVLRWEKTLSAILDNVSETKNRYKALTSTETKIPYLKLSAKGTLERRDELENLHFPRACVDDRNHLLDRFTTDDEKFSGRLWDRLYRTEVPRIVPCMEYIRPNCIYDVLKDQIRDRTTKDEGLEVRNLKMEVAGSCLRVSRREWGSIFFVYNGHRVEDYRDRDQKRKVNRCAWDDDSEDDGKELDWSRC